MRSTPKLVRALTVLAIAGLASACGAGDDARADGSRPSIVVTTSILGDVVTSMVGDHAEVTTIMPPGASPHDFQVSARQGQAMREADLLVVNGAGFEEGLHDVIEAAEKDGVRVHEAISVVDTIELNGDDDHGHGGEGDHAAPDPHFFTDPTRMAVAARGILDELLEQVPALDTDEARGDAEAFVEELERLDGDVADILAVIPADQRVLVTTHQVFGYFADRYDFELMGTVMPGGSTTNGASAGVLADLIELIEREGIPAIFTDTSSSDDLSRTVAREAGGIEVVELYSESLGGSGSGADTYPTMVLTNAQRIADSLS